MELPTRETIKALAERKPRTVGELFALVGASVSDEVVRAWTSETFRVPPLEGIWEKDCKVWEKDPTPPTTAEELGKRRVYRWKLTLPFGLADIDAALTEVLGPPIPHVRDTRRYGAFIVMPDGGDACTLVYYGYSLEQALDLERIAVRPDAAYVATAAASGRLRVFSPADLRVTGDFHLGFKMPALAWTPDGQRLLAHVENRNAIHVFTADGAKHVETFESGEAPAELAALLAGGAPPITLAAYEDAADGCLVNGKPIALTAHPRGRVMVWKPGVPPTKLAEIAFVDHLVPELASGDAWARLVARGIDKTCAACGAAVAPIAEDGLGETCPACGHVAPDLAIAYPQLAIAKEVRPALLAVPNRSPKALRCLAIANLFTDVELGEEMRWAIRAADLDAAAGHGEGAQAAERRADSCLRAGKTAREGAVRLPPLEQVLPRLFDDAGPPPTVGALEQALGLDLTGDRVAASANGRIAFADPIGPDVTSLTLEYSLRRPITTLEELRARPLTAMTIDFRRGRDAIHAAVVGPGWTVTPLEPSGACRLAYVEPPRS